VISGAPVLTVGAGAASPVGTYVITNQLGTLHTTNYTFVLVNGTLTVTPAPLTVTANPATKVYGQTLALGGSTQFSASGLQNGETIGAVTLAIGNNGSAATAAVGGYPITPSAATGGTFNPANYAITYVNGSLAVTPAALGVTANSTNQLYGAVTPLLAATFTGFVNGDTAAVISGAPALMTAATAGSPVGTYVITNTPGTLTATNYTFSLTNGTLTVTPAPLTVTANPATKVYGQTLALGSSTQFSASGLQNGETIGSVILAASNNGGAATAAVAGSPYLITPSAATGGTFNPANYAVTYINGSLTVTPAVLGVTANNTSQRYGTATPPLTATFTGFVNGESLGHSDVGGVPALTTAATTGSPVGTYVITAAPGTLTSTNYIFSLTNGTLTVALATITVTANPQSRAYGAANPSLTVSYAGFLNGDTAAVISGAPVLTVGATATSPTGTYVITSQLGTLYATNYTFSLANGTLAVTPAPLTVTANPITKVYGQTLALGSSTQFSASGLQNGDTIGSVTLTVGNNGGATNATVAGSPYLITPGAATGGTFNPANYAINYANGSLTVTPAVLGVTANNTNQLYGAPTPILTAAFTGFVNGESLGHSDVGGVPALTTAATAASAVGTYVITNMPGTLTSTNYTFNLTNGTLTVVLAPPATTCAIEGSLSATSLTYGQPVGASTLSGIVTNSAGAVLPGTFTFNSPATNLPAGTFSASVTFTPTDTTDYSSVTGNVSVTITPAPLTITATPATKVYGKTLAMSSGSLQFTAGGLKSGDTIGSVTLTLGNNGGAATAAVGGYPLTPSAATGGTFNPANYAITYTPGVLTVTPAPLTVTANAAIKGYGQTMNFGSYNTEFTSSGLQNGETIGSVTLAVANNGGAATAVPGGYTITPGAATGGTFNRTNYTIAYAPGTLTVNPGVITVVPTPQSRAYGATNPVLTVSYSGFVNGDTAAVISGASMVSTGAGATSPVGLNIINIHVGTLSATNYIMNVQNGLLTITPAALTVTASPESKTYGQTLTFGGGSTLFTATNLQNGETIGTVTLAVSNNGGAATAAVGSYTVTPSAAIGGTFNPTNYTISYATNILTVTPAAQALAGRTVKAVKPPSATARVKINNPVVLADGTIQLTFSGGNAGTGYEVQAGADLSHWTTLTNEVAGTNGLPAYNDTGATNAGIRFYRTVTP